MIDQNAPFKAAPRITRADFATIIQRDANPALAMERDPGEYFDAIAAYGVDPLFLLAMFNHESTLGKAGTAMTTHSWGNTRDPSFGATPTREIAGRSGTFPAFANWLDGAKSTAARLVEPTWVYADRTRIIDIFDWPAAPDDVWAPAGDLNDPAGYVRAVLDYMNAHASTQTGGAPVAVDISGFTPPKIVDQWFPVNGVSYLGRDMQMHGVCVHQTGNTDPGAEAQQNVDYMNSAACIQRQASWHDTVGLNVIIRTIPHNKQAYHASDGDAGEGNMHFVAVEHVVCYPVGSAEYGRVMRNGAWYVAKSLREAGLPCNGDTLKQHHDFARDGKDCPMQFRDHNEWGDYVALVQAFYAAGAPAPQPQQPADDALHFDGTSYTYQLGFKALFLELGAAKFPSDPIAGGLSVLGLPLGNEYATATGSAQLTERALLLYTANVAAPWDVTVAFRDAQPPEAA